MNNKEEIYKIALSFLKGVTPAVVRHISELGLTPEEFFSRETSELKKKLNLNSSELIDKYIREVAYHKALVEYKNIERHKIDILFLLDDSYPYRLSEINDAPIILYKLGENNLDSRHIISVVGTRRPTPYGNDFCNKLVNDLAIYFPDITVVSGLAYGIDATSHMAALSSNVSTVAVVAHGLDMIYPASHRDLARNIIKAGGAIISEYPFSTKPFRTHFLERNRIVAAISDVTVVVESAIKGGAISTANYAFSYSRDVMALPGRISDELSSGCNLLIRKEKAHLVGAAADVIETTGWKPLDIKIEPQQRNLFPELSGDFKVIYDILRFNREPIQLDKLHQLSAIPISRLMSALGEMEFDGIIIKHPGNRFSIS